MGTMDAVCTPACATDQQQQIVSEFFHPFKGDPCQEASCSATEREGLETVLFPHPVLAGFDVVINKVRAGLSSWISYCAVLQRLPAKP